MYSITRTGYNTFKLTFTFDVTSTIVYYKVNKLNPITFSENNISLELPEGSQFSYATNDYIKVEQSAGTLDVNITLTTDAVYYIYVKYNDTEYKHVLVNVKTITDYLFETAKENICCCPVKPCNYSTFANKDYIFNVVSNMSFCFLGWEFRDINELVGSIPSTLSGRINEVAEIIYRINEYLLNPNFEYSC